MATAYLGLGTNVGNKRGNLVTAALLLGAVGYRGFVSVEMAHTDVDTIRRTMDYIAEVFA